MEDEPEDLAAAAAEKGNQVAEGTTVLMNKDSSVPALMSINRQRLVSSRSPLSFALLYCN